MYLIILHNAIYSSLFLNQTSLFTAVRYNVIDVSPYSDYHLGNHFKDISSAIAKEFMPVYDISVKEN